MFSVIKLSFYTLVSCLGVDTSGNIETECGCTKPKIKYEDCITDPFPCPPSSQQPTGYTLVGFLQQNMTREISRQTNLVFKMVVKASNSKSMGAP